MLLCCKLVSVQKKDVCNIIWLKNNSNNNKELSTALF